MLGSYGQVFFSKHTLFGALLLLASFADVPLALAGLYSVLCGLVFAKLLQYDEESISNGTFTFNALLSGMALSAMYEPSMLLLLLITFAALLAVLFSGAFLQMGKHLGIPFLSLPFIITVWLLQLAIRKYWLQDLSTRSCVSSWQAFPHIEQYFHYRSVTLGYFKSLSQIFFQKSVLSGFIIALGLLLHSRIAFMLSVLGYSCGWLLAHIPALHLHGHHHFFGAFNFMLTAIALGGYFYVPSRSSFLLAIISMPVVLLMSALSSLPGTFALAPYSLAFSLSVIIMLAALRNRKENSSLELTAYQSFSPESNLYAAALYKLRFGIANTLPIHLPFFGKWLVTQAHDGSITHKDEHRFAFDFSVTDEHKRSFKLPGKSQEDFYCFGLPVVAPAEGRVVKIINTVEDNAIGDTNLTQNWGNTIVIKHSDYLYSKISHLKKESCKVQVGDYVQAGAIIANCGNSGRSPEPHIHFQLQTIAAVGAGTLKFPLANYVVEKENQVQFFNRAYPRENEFVQQALANTDLSAAFNWHLDQIITIEENTSKQRNSVKACYDGTLGHYLFCSKTGSKAFYTKDNYSISFSYFQGKQDTALYHLFLVANAVPFVENAVYTAPLLASTLVDGLKKVTLDSVAAFIPPTHPQYSAQVVSAKEEGYLVTVKIENRKQLVVTAQLHIRNQKLQSFSFDKINYQCI